MSEDDDDSSYGENEVDEIYIIDEISQYEYYQAPIDANGYPTDERRDGNYYIGCYSYHMDSYLDTTEGYTIKVLEKSPKLFFGECVCAKTFFHFDFSDIVRFLSYCNRDPFTNPQYTNNEVLLPFEPNFKVHIMKLYIEPVTIYQEFIQDFIAEQYLCVLKTHWISLVQRHWKSVLLARKKYVEYYRNPKHLWTRELGGRELGKKIGGPKISGLRGMLSCYSTK
jgi:hypothetical protein